MTGSSGRDATRPDDPVTHRDFIEANNYDAAPVASVTPLAQPVANKNVIVRHWGGGKGHFGIDYLDHLSRSRRDKADEENPQNQRLLDVQWQDCGKDLDQHNQGHQHGGGD